MNYKLLKTVLIASLLTSTIAVADTGDIFAGVSLGYTYTNIDQKDNTGSIILGNELEENGYNFKLEAGYQYTSNIDVLVNYQRVEFDDTYLNNFFLSTEYKCKKYNDLTPYLGGQLGFSQMHWKKNPINTLDNDYTSESYFIGVLAGISYPINEKLSLNVNYNLQYMDHDTQLESSPAHSTLTHNYFHSFNIGVRWEFLST